MILYMLMCLNNKWSIMMIIIMIPRNVKPLGSEVVVGAQCGSAVLRGAHVFAPGILASPKSKIPKCIP